MTAADHPPPKRTGLFWVALTAAAVLSFYSGGYLWARWTHRLVNYNNSFIARPHVLSGIGITWWELVFYPATAAEGALRRTLKN